MSAEGKPERALLEGGPTRSYGAVAWCYDELAALYSLGQIDRAKGSQVRELGPGDRVLFAGAGRGREAIVAAGRGAEVTCLDVAPTMLRRIEGGLARRGYEARLIEQDVFAHACARGYDVVAANFFLNLFAAPRVSSALRALALLLRPGGRFMIADFAPPSGGRLQRWLASAYFRPLNVVASLVGLCDRHPGHDSARLLGDAGLVLERRESFPLWPGGSVGFEVLVARKPCGADGSDQEDPAP